MEKGANVGDEFVSTQQFSRGQGATSRARAVEGIDEQAKHAQDEIDAALVLTGKERRKRAKANWHLALELITTGALSDELMAQVSPKMSFLWKWRGACIQREEENDSSFDTCAAPCLLRGWRPHSTFAESLLSSNPTFHWAKPRCLILENIPPQVSLDDVTMALYEGMKREPRVKDRLVKLRRKLDKEKGTIAKSRIQSDISEAEAALADAISHDEKLQQPNVIAVTNVEKWMAYVHDLQLSGEEELMRQARTTAGIVLKSTVAVPHIEDIKKAAQERFDQAEAQCNVHPSQKHTKEKADAKKALEKANVGLTINFVATMNNVAMSRAASVRGTSPGSKTAFVESAYDAIAKSTDSLGRARARLESGRSTLARLTTALSRGVNEVSQRSAYSTLEALRRNEFSETFCPVSRNCQ